MQRTILKFLRIAQHEYYTTFVLVLQVFFEKIFDYFFSFFIFSQKFGQKMRLFFFLS